MDIGANAGIISVVAAQKFNKVIAVEAAEHYFLKSLKTLEVFYHHGYKTNNISLNHTNFLYYIKSGTYKKDKISAIMGFQILYHLSDKDIGALIILLQDAQRVIFGTKHSRKHSDNKHDLRTIGTVKKFLKTNGFSNIQVRKEKSNYATVIASNVG